MHDIRRYSAYPSNLNVLASFIKLRDHFAAAGLTEQRSYALQLTVDENRSLIAGSFEEFMRALEQHPGALPLRCWSFWGDKKGGSFGLSIEIQARDLKVSVDSSDLHLVSGLHEKVKDIFQASNPRVERSACKTRNEAKKTVFLAHRFDDCGTRASTCLKTFLTRLGFGVLEGSGYETRDIPEKVSERIAAQDIFMCVATPGDTSWIVSEASFAKALNKYMIVLVQNKVRFNRGILGQDHEYLMFPPNNIEKAFNDLLFALPS